MQRYCLNANGRERSRVLANIHDFLDRLPENKSWSIEIKLLRKSRTLDQNAALWGVAYPPICQATGYVPDELHEAMCRKFFGTIGVDVMGEIVCRPARTTTTGHNGEHDIVDRATFADFYAMVQRIGAEIGVDVPDPDPLWREKVSA